MLSLLITLPLIGVFCILSVPEEKEIIKYLSKIETEIKFYSEYESKFNDLYRENLNRNILDEYEDGSLDLKIKNTNELFEGKRLGPIDMVDKNAVRARYSPEMLPEFIIDKGTRLRYIQIVFTK